MWFAGRLLQAYANIQRVSATNRWVVHTYEVLTGLERCLSIAKDAETGQRGFILTSDPNYLVPFNTAAREFDKDIDRLESLTRDNPDQQQKCRQLRKSASAKLAELQATIKLFREGKTAEALAIIRTNRGQASMDEIRLLVNSMECGLSPVFGTPRKGRAAGAAAGVVRGCPWMVANDRPL